MYDVYKPTVIFGKEGKTRLRRTDNVHKVNVYAACALVQHTVDIESEEHQYKQELQAVEVIFNGELHFLVGVQVKGEHNEEDVVSKVLRRDKPTAVSRGVRGDENCRNAAKQTTGTHEGKQEAVNLFVLHQEENGDKDKLNGAKVEG